MKRLALLTFVILMVTVVSATAWWPPRDSYLMNIKEEKHATLNFLIEQEGLELAAYPCSPDPADHSKWHWAIGIGTPSYAGERISELEAKQRAIQHIKKVRRCMNRTIKVPISHNQRVALTSFIYNIGRTAWKKSTVLSQLNHRNYTAVPKLMQMYNKVTGPDGNKRVSKGLVKRRRAEARVFCTPLPGGG